MTSFVIIKASQFSRQEIHYHSKDVKSNPKHKLQNTIKKEAKETELLGFIVHTLNYLLTSPNLKLT